jgi:hypothetical protein
MKGEYKSFSSSFSSVVMYIQCAGKSPPQEHNELKKKHSEETNKKYYNDRICFLPFFNCKQGDQLACYIKKLFALEWKEQ